MTSDKAPDGGPRRQGPAAAAADQDIALARLRTDVDNLADQVADLADVLAEGNPKAPPWPDWHILDASQAEKAWTELWRWLVGYLVPTYAPTRAELPDCWTRHPGMRDELSWLRGTHRAAYGTSGGPAVVSSWHLTYRPGAFANIAVLAKRLGCEPGTCRGERLLDHLPREGELTSEDCWLTDGINADLENRPSST